MTKKKIGPHGKKKSVPKLRGTVGADAHSKEGKKQYSKSGYDYRYRSPRTPKNMGPRPPPKKK
jgi:hypothetical protein